MSTEYKIAETQSFSKKMEAAIYKKLYIKIYAYVYPQLRRNPFFGPNIKRLKGKYSDYYRYRIGDYRLFYRIEKEKVTVFIIEMIHRKKAYKKEGP